MGCVAIALGNIMYHHKHPESGHGVLEEYRGHPSVVLDDFSYNWSLIPQKLSNNSTIDEINMTSNLVMHISRACDIDAYGSFASTLSKGIKALTENFNYDINFTKVEINNEELCYTNEDILNIAKDELISGRPFFVEIFGHSIMCNGYKENLFSFNWGWGYVDEWHTLDYLGVNPIRLGIGIRPKEEESIICIGYHVDFSGNFSGDLGEVKIHVQPLNPKCEATYRVVLHDASGIRRNIISEEIEHASLTNDMGVFSFKLPSNMTLGDRDICVEYKTPALSYRPLRNNHQEKECFRFEAKRNNSTTSLVSAVGWPEVLRTNDSFDVNLVIKNGCVEFKNIALVLADNNFNIISVLGFCDNTGGEFFERTITCSLNDVRPEKNYRVIALASNMGNFTSASPLINTTHILPEFVYIRNSEINTAENIEIISIAGLDLSNKFLSDTTYPYDITFNIIEPKNELVNIYLMITDLDDNVISVEFRGGITNFNPTIHSALPRLNVGETESSKAFKVFHCLEHIDQNGNKTYLMIPSHDDIIENPLIITVDHLNYYTQLFITESLKTEKEIIKKNEPFEISTSVIYDRNGGSVNFMASSLTAIANNSKREKVIIGKTIVMGFLPNVKTPVNISCVFPEDCDDGFYEIYLQAGDQVNSKSTPPEQVYEYEYEINATLYVKVE